MPRTATTKKMVSKPVPAEPAEDVASLRARLTKLEGKKSKSREDDEEEDEDTDEEVSLPTYNPATHTVITHETLRALACSKTETERSTNALINASSKQQEQISTVLVHATDLNEKQRVADLAYGNAQRDEVTRLNMENAALHMKLADQVRQSEDARLERERLATELARGEQAARRQINDLAHAKDIRQAELTAITNLAAPTFQRLAPALNALIMSYVPSGVVGPPGQGPSGPARAPTPMNGAAPGTSPGTPAPVAYQVNAEGTADWKTAFVVVLDALTPPSIACLRAVLASYLLHPRDPRMPPVPPGVAEQLVARVFQDAGEEKVMALLNACWAAYVIEAQVPPSPSATSAPN